MMVVEDSVVEVCVVENSVVENSREGAAGPGPSRASLLLFEGETLIK